MKALAFILTLFAAGTAYLAAGTAYSETIADDPVKAFTHTATCSIILGAAAAEAEPKITFEPGPDSDNSVFVGIWAEMRAAATMFEGAMNVYAQQIRESNTEYSKFSTEVLLDIVYQSIGKMTREQQVKFGKACITGYNMAIKERKHLKGA